ncbi:hypothetical protein LINPERHAP1_LOCUS9128, partial [Linum perenne]
MFLIHQGSKIFINLISQSGSMNEWHVKSQSMNLKKHWHCIHYLANPHHVLPSTQVALSMVFDFTLRIARNVVKVKIVVLWSKGIILMTLLIS